MFLNARLPLYIFKTCKIVFLEQLINIYLHISISVYNSLQHQMHFLLLKAIETIFNIDTTPFLNSKKTLNVN